MLKDKDEYERIELKRSFSEYNCLSLWHECYEQLTVNEILADIERRERNYLDLPVSELTIAERGFLEMVSAWN